MLKIFNPAERIAICVAAVESIDFSKIDSRISASAPFESYPMYINISVPKDSVEEIIEKLKLHNGVIAVNDELTDRGIAMEEEMNTNRAQFGF